MKSQDAMAEGHWPVAFRPLHVPDQEGPVGFVPLECAALLERHGLVRDRALRLTLMSHGDLSERLDAVRVALLDHGWIGPLRNEPMPVRATFDGPTLAVVDRSVLRVLGLWATKVHINGLVAAEPDSLPHVWLSRRSEVASAFPGSFDTLVAGGQSHGTSVKETADREAWEEAGIAESRLEGLRHVRTFPVQYVSRQGFHRELLAVYDLWLDSDFVPVCMDGEIDESCLFSWKELRAGLAGELALKFGSRLVCEDLVARSAR